MSNDLSGRVAVITGATGGLGRAIATELYHLGASVVLSGRSTDKLYQLRNDLGADTTQNAPGVLCVTCDLSAPFAEQDLIQRTIRKFGRLDILVNNAGDVSGRLFLKTDPQFLAYMMQVNFTAPYYLCQSALPHMVRNKFGRIINITSVAGIMGDAGMSAYAASKGALAAATKSIAAEYGRRGITANCIAPGVIGTSAADSIPEKRAAEIKTEIPVRRFGRAEEVAHAAAMLASERASYINGQQIHIDGGLLR